MTETMNRRLLLQLFFYTLSFFPEILKAQKKNLSQTIVEDSAIKKWVHATINIECFPRNSRPLNYWSYLKFNNKITDEELHRKLDSANKIVYYGTAIFFTDSGRYYLITARHVLEDQSSYLDKGIFKNILLVKNSISNKNFIAFQEQSSQSWSGEFHGRENINFDNESDYEGHFYIFSDEDIAILDLTACDCGTDFVRRLLELGYKPITISDISTSSKIEAGGNIFAVGFPQESVVSNTRLPKQLSELESGRRSLPIISKGTISKEDNTENYFHANIFIYHGNSGGPVVFNNKLLGITVSYSLKTMNNHTNSLNEYIIWENNFLKSSLISPLLKKLQIKIRSLGTHKFG